MFDLYVVTMVTLSIKGDSVLIFFLKINLVLKHRLTPAAIAN